MRFAGLALVVVVVAGCSMPGTPPDGAGDAEPSDEAEPMAGSSNSTQPQFLRGLGCGDGIDTAIESPIAAGRPPPGWEYSGPLGNQIYLEYVTCARVKLDSTEWNHVQFMIEGHQNFSVPQNCLVRDAPRLVVLSNIITDSAEMARNLNMTLGIPTAVAAMSSRAGNQGGLATRNVSWQPAGFASSYLQVAIVPIDPASFVLENRYVWAFNGTLWYMDVRQDSKVYALTGSASGTLNRPMVWADTGVTDYVGPGTLVLTQEFVGRIGRFADFECHSPASLGVAAYAIGNRGS